MTTLKLLEKQVLQKFLFGENEILDILRKQVLMASVSSREMTGVGFFTKFVIPSDAQRILSHTKFILSDVIGTASNVKDGVGFVLFIGNGVLATLEGYTYDEPWPNEIQNLELSYSAGKIRDMDNLNKMMMGNQRIH